MALTVIIGVGHWCMKQYHRCRRVAPRLYHGKAELDRQEAAQREAAQIATIAEVKALVGENHEMMSSNQRAIERLSEELGFVKGSHSPIARPPEPLTPAAVGMSPKNPGQRPGGERSRDPRTQCTVATGCICESRGYGNNRYVMYCNLHFASERGSCFITACTIL
jgi:hypothetical protein